MPTLPDKEPNEFVKNAKEKLTVQEHVVENIKPNSEKVLSATLQRNKKFF